MGGGYIVYLWDWLKKKSSLINPFKAENIPDKNLSLCLIEYCINNVQKKKMIFFQDTSYYLTHIWGGWDGVISFARVFACKWKVGCSF